MKKIILTGGGTAGHVIPNIALIPALKDIGFEIYYVGSYNGIEKQLITELKIPYYGINTGKLRRYFDIKNFTDPFRILKGLVESQRIIKELKPDIIFSKGGYVSVPIVTAAHLQHIPVILHESDITIGLANKLSIPSCDRICCSFPETLNSLPKNKSVLTGPPIREELLNGSKEDGFAFCNLPSDKPLLLVTGGSLGSVNINNFIRNILDTLLNDFNIVHLCGKGKVDPSFNDVKGYVQYEYVGKELKDLMAAADIVVSRAGAGTISELVALRKPNLLIPLSKNASRGDQILNARSYENQGYSKVLEEEEIRTDVLYKTLTDLYSERDKYIKNMSQSHMQNSNSVIIELIASYVN